MESLGLLYVFAAIFGIVLIIAWIILPFAVIGTKDLLQELIDETKRTNELLSARLQEPPIVKKP